jgi:1-acyl-sn-glycerol-3-phosphate acyltransferase
MLRLGFVIAVFAGGAATLSAVQLCLRAIGSSPQPNVSMFFYRILRRLLRLRVRVSGAPVTDRPVIFIANHKSAAGLWWG